MIGVGTQEGRNVGSTGQLVEATLLDRLQILGSDAKARSDVINREFAREALIPQ